MRYLDCNTFIGRPSGHRPYLTRAVSPGELAAEMDRVGIHEAAVYHVLAHEYAPQTGNELLLSELGRAPEGVRERLRPVGVVLPPHTGEVPEPEELVAGLLAAGVRMARIFPSSEMAGHRFSLAPWCSGELLAALERVRMPLAVDFTLFRRGEPPWREVHDLAEGHPGLPVILMDVQGRNNRTLYPLLKRFGNLYVQSAGFNVHRGLEDLCSRFGAHRVVFGSGYPLRSMGGARMQLDGAGLPAADRELIASGTLAGLLAAVTVKEEIAYAG
ncbi:putative TIM-barrel fold metal-dependent hydrolase [Thermocatellispora tengchongensis]|uniref:Putative TIM-barrel fold metal-dependent hydrolase n=1 Tax=Thermocatellispora tengchongensis TaxID=1073253 RepID=A0A840P1I3_9ACTN|nr:amidohydrolase family protein [Thermocatellispora tengchongensis]MBB5133558.1 putative TIM-barrel fold metal-dependent hydrolase [Thermocatellispora tengchongensis]